MTILFDVKKDDGIPQMIDDVFFVCSSVRTPFHPSQRCAKNIQQRMNQDRKQGKKKMGETIQAYPQEAKIKATGSL